MEKKGPKPSGLKKISHDKKETRRYHVLPPFPCGVKKATTLLWHWIKDNVILLSEVELIPSITGQKDTMERRPTLEQGFSFRKIFDEKHMASEILFQKAVSIKGMPF